MRNTFTMTEIETAQFYRLRPNQGEAIAFWNRVAQRRELDPKSMITEGHFGRFTALPLNHGKHWCFPIPLKCQKKPVYKD